MAAIQVHNLAEQRDFLHALVGEASSLPPRSLGNGPTAFAAARVGHDAEGAFHVAALHDADEGARLAVLELVIADGVLRMTFPASTSTMLKRSSSICRASRARMICST